QPEIGILGILSKRFGGVRHFLMQAKAEPGNINIVQLSPTVQATQSNYRRVHGGSAPNYLEYFAQVPAEQRLVDQLQTEQGSRFLKKRNRNMIVDVADEVPVLDGFRWLTLGEIKKFQQIENFVNMDARSVISCIPYVARNDREGESVNLPEAGALKGFEKDLLASLCAESSAMHSMDALLAWLTEMRTRFELRAEPIPLAEVKNWKITENEIAHESHKHFSVIAVAVEAGRREVARWTQPLLKDAATGLHGFITQKHGGLLHFLVQAKVEPGNIDVVDLAPTVSRSNIEHVRERAAEHPFLDHFLEARPEEIRYSVIQSEEGGRFYQLENRNTILEIDAGTALEMPDHFTWMTLRQLLEFLKHGYLSVDARTLLACASLI
ncbi:MAG: NDP-hexose 2,3-dehydratase family protein, partial [Deltaproteobacteria bacterium]|nr:NDP-hexose 2,3-dehydratase family protein [Deltaproteobacteria bacterium]